jgi:hypothetical protein
LPAGFRKAETYIIYHLFWESGLVLHLLPRSEMLGISDSVIAQ